MTSVSVCHDDSKIGRHSVDRQRIGRLRRSFARTWHRSSGRSARCSAGSAVRIGYIRCALGSSSKYRLNGGLENKNDAGCGSRPASLPPCAAVGSHRWLTTVSGLPAIVLSAQRLRQLGDVGGDAPSFVARQEVRRRPPSRLLLVVDVGERLPVSAAASNAGDNPNVQPSDCSSAQGIGVTSVSRLGTVGAATLLNSRRSGPSDAT